METPQDRPGGLSCQHQGGTNFRGSQFRISAV